MDTRTPLQAGAIVERFEIGRKLARGETGFLYRVTEVRGGSAFLLQEWVPGGHFERDSDGAWQTSDDSTRSTVVADQAGFIAAATLMINFSHPNVASCLRWFRASGTVCLLVRSDEGETLAEALAGGKFTGVDGAAALASPLLDGLAALHQADLYQHHLAPGFIYLSAGGAPQLVGAGPPGACLPDDHTDWCSPIEQTRPDAETGPWTDIYRLSAVLYACIAGFPPPLATVRQQVVEQGAADPLELPERTDDMSARQREVVALVERGLALEPAARPQSVAEWQLRVSRVPDGATANSQLPSANAVPATGTEDRKEWLPRVLLGLLLAALVVVTWLLLVDRPAGSGGLRDDSPPPAPAPAISPEETERWRQALEADAVIGYRTFMADFPDSVHLETARQHIDRLEAVAWQDVESENTRAAYEAHLDVFPEGQFATEALARIEAFRQQQAREEREQQERQRQDDAAWDEARQQGTIDALDKYIASWPGGSHVEEARNLRQQMQGDTNDSRSFREAQQKHTIAAYRDYMDVYPSGRHVPAAQEAIESLTLRVGRTFRDCADCPEMVVVPDGAFWQGSADSSEYAITIEKPRRRVQIDRPFAVSVHEITLEQWDRCVADQGCDEALPDNGWGRGSRPAIMVSWNDAMQYAGWLSKKTGQEYTLPSESEWEYLARAGESGEWPGGSIETVCDHGNVADAETGFEWRYTQCTDGFALQTAPVGSFRPNAFGVHDVIGNVSEWTLDCMNLSYLEAPADGSAWTRGMCSSRMTRGGSWFTGPKESRLAARFNLRSGDRNDFTGFRLVRRVELQ